MRDLSEYESDVAEMAQALYEGGHSEDESMTIAWAWFTTLSNLGLI